MRIFFRHLPLTLCVVAAFAGEEKPDLSIPKMPDFYQAPDAALPKLAILPAHAHPNIILMIGDGMGGNHVAVARRSVGGVDARLYMDRMPIVGLVLTHSVDKPVTDSAAADTALSCAIKTRTAANQ